MISRNRSTKVEFSCAFLKNQEVDIGGIHPYIDNTVRKSDSEGTFEIQMALFDSSDFQNLQSPEFDIKVPDKLFAQIELKNAPGAFVVQLFKCWATPT
jgi:hypothetical protein